MTPMSRPQCIAMVVMLATAILGMVFAFVAPEIAVRVMPEPSFNPGAPGALPTMKCFFSAVNTTVSVAERLHLSGLAAAGMGLLGAFTIWARWFVSRQPQETLIDT